MASEEKTMFELRGVIKNNDWGKRGSSSQVAQLAKAGDSNVEIDENLPYAELWMGTHKNGPSPLVAKNSNETILLSDWLLQHPCVQESCCHDKAELPFLFKVLSAGKTLALQAHPDKKQAIKMHKTHPELYPDSNHKPEMAIALTPFTGLCGFRPINEIAFFLLNIPKLKQVTEPFSTALVNSIGTKDADLNQTALKDWFTSLLHLDQATINALIDDVKLFIKQTESKQEDTALLEWDLFMKINEEYPRDVGCFAVFYLNVFQLRAGEAIFIKERMPHAYISGDCIECMACSDNTLRGGLTHKHRDLKTLCEILDYNSAQSRLCEAVKQDHLRYFGPNAGTKDFMITELHAFDGPSSKVLPAVDSGSIVLIINGEGCLRNPHTNESLQFHRGSICFVSSNQDIQVLINTPSVLLYRASLNVLNE